ncbi:SpaA isopeptide-forming pilin-related protein [Enterococcus sp. LJL128]
MKKILHGLMVLSLMVPFFVPVASLAVESSEEVAVESSQTAVSTSSDEEPPVSTSATTAISSESESSTSSSSSEPAKANELRVIAKTSINKSLEQSENKTQQLLTLKIAGELLINDLDGRIPTITVAADFIPEPFENGLLRGAVHNAAGEVIGTYQLQKDEQNQESVIQLIITNPTLGETGFYLEFTGVYTENENQVLSIISEGQEPFQLNIPENLLEQPEASTTTSSSEANSSVAEETKTETTEDTSVNQLPNEMKAKDTRRAAVNVAELFSQLAPGENFVRSIDTAFEPDPATIDSDIHFQLNFQLPPIIQDELQAGDYYELPLPAGIDVTSLQSGDLTDPDNGNEKYGEYQIDPVTNTLKITFTQNTNGDFLPASAGQVNYTAHFDSQVITTPGTKTFHYPIESQIPPFTVVIHPKNTDSISKSGNSDRAKNPSKITWNVDINKDLSTLKNASVTEAFPSQVTYQSVAIYPIQLNFDGTVASVGTMPLSSSDYSVDSAGNVTFLSDISSAYRLVYETTINDAAKPVNGGSLTVTNKATLKAEGLADTPASASVSLNYGKFLEKKMTAYHNVGQTYDWTVQYNYGQKDIPIGVPITDTYSGNMVLTSGNPNNLTSGSSDPVLYYVNFDKNGNPQKGNPVPENAYTIARDEANHTFSITFNDNVQKNQAVNIYYTTKVTDVVSDNGSTKITNNISSNGITPPAPITETPKQQTIIKNKPVVDRGPKVAHWTIDINKNRYQIENAVIRDTVNGATEGYISLPYTTVGVPTSYGVRLVNQNGEVLVSGVDYDFTTHSSGANYDYFTVTLKGKYASTTDSFKMSYYTWYDVSKGVETPTYTFSNRVGIDWTTDGKNYHSDSTNGFTASTEEANQGTKSGSYNPLTKEITWTVVANYNNVGVAAFGFLDSITGNQQFIDGSLSIVRGNINPQGRFSATTNPLYSGEQVENPYISYTSPSANVPLTVDFGKSIPIPGWDQSQLPGDTPMVFQLTFKTSLKGQIVNNAATYHNIGKVFIGDKEENLPADVSIAYAGEEVNKSAAYDAASGLITWDIWVNRSQSALLRPTLVDNPSSNQTVNEQSVRVYRGNVAANGSITKGALVPSSQYTIRLETDNTTGSEELAVVFDNIEEGNGAAAGVIEQPYLVEYTTTPNFSAQTETVSNTAKLVSEGGETVGPPSTSNKQVKIETSTGVAWGVKGSLTIQKTDTFGSVLPGAKLQLIRHYLTSNGPADKVLYEVTTDESGKAVFSNLVYTQKTGNNPFVYLLKEVEAPDGYTISEELLNGQEITVDAATSALGAVTPVLNERVTLHVNKKNELGLPVVGALFRLNHEVNGQMVPFNEYPPVRSTDAGFFLSGLKDGNYELAEVVPGDNYLLNNKPLPFTVAKKANGQRGVFINNGMTEVNSLDFVNYQASAQLLKTNEDGQGLNGAEFKLQRADYGSSEYSDVRSAIVSTTRNGQDGVVFVDYLGPGLYRLIETAPAEGYYLNTTPVDFTVGLFASERPETIQTSVNGASGLVNYKGTASFMKTDNKDTPLPNAEFELLDGQNQPVLDDSGSPITIISGADGKLIVENLSPGTQYGLKEIEAPQGYVLNDTILKFTMPVSTAGSSNDNAVINQPEDKLVYEEAVPFKNYKGIVRFTKLGQDKLSDSSDQVPLANARYHLFEVENGVEQQITSPDYGADEEGYFSSNEEGYIQAGDLEPGSYYFKEAVAPAGYILDTKTIPFTIPAEGIGDPGIMELNQNGINYKGAAFFVKHNEKGAAVADAEFDVLLKKQNGTEVVNHVVSDEQGRVYVEGLAPGDYEFLETGTKNSEYITNTEAISFSISQESDGQPQVVSARENDEPFINYLGSAQLIKTNNIGQPLAGAQFKVIKSGDNPDTGSPVGGNEALESDEQGRVTAINLAPGSYEFVETKAPSGYLLNSTSVPFVISSSAAGQPETVTENQSGLLTQINYKGTAKLLKTDSNEQPLGGAHFKLIDGLSGETVQTDLVSQPDGFVTAENLAPGTYRFVETQAPDGYLLNTQELKNFVIPETAQGQPEAITLDVNEDTLTAVNYQGSARITKMDEAGKPIAGAFFKVVNQEGKTISGQEAIKSDSLGQATAKNLAPGTYRFVETKAPSGYVLNTNPSDTFEIPDEAEGQPLIIVVGSNGKQLELTNFKGTVQFKKVDEQGQPLKDAVFEIRNGQTNSVVPGYDFLVSDQDGLVKATGLSPGEYRLVETKAPNGFAINTEALSFTIESEADKQPVKNLGSFINYEGSVVLTKRERENEKNVLSGAVFELRDGTGKVLQEGLVSNAAGQIMVANLAPGSYTFVETHAPNGYLKDSSPVGFTIAAASQGKPKAVQVSKKNSVSPLPHAGDSQSFTLIFMGLSVIAGALYLFFRRKRA